MFRPLQRRAASEVVDQCPAQHAHQGWAVGETGAVGGCDLPTLVGAHQVQRRECQPPAQVDVEHRHLTGPRQGTGSEFGFEQAQVPIRGEAQGHGIGPLPEQRVAVIELAGDLGVFRQQGLHVGVTLRGVAPTPFVTQRLQLRVLPTCRPAAHALAPVCFAEETQTGKLEPTRVPS